MVSGSVKSTSLGTTYTLDYTITKEGAEYVIAAALYSYNLMETVHSEQSAARSKSLVDGLQEILSCPKVKVPHFNSLDLQYKVVKDYSQISKLSGFLKSNNIRR